MTDLSLTTTYIVTSDPVPVSPPAPRHPLQKMDLAAWFAGDDVYQYPGVWTPRPKRRRAEESRADQ